MAKIPKGRIILYVVLGIIVIIGGVFILKEAGKERAKQKGRVVEVEDIPKEVRRWTREIDKLTPYISRLSGEDAAHGQEVLQQLTAQIQEFQTLTDPMQLTEKRNEIVDNIAELRRLKRIALREE